MRLAMIGLGRMGGNMARRLMRGGHEIVAFDRDQDAVAKLVADGATAASSLEDARAKMPDGAIWWVMLPAGPITDGVIRDICEGASHDCGEVVIDGGNSFYKDDIRRAKDLREKGMHYIDVGTSGGVWGLERGYCMMIGGPDEQVRRLDPLFSTLAPGAGDIPRTQGREAAKNADPRAEKGYIYAGSAGAGHFVKMVHNGIEYGLMQAYAEGFDVLKTKASEKLPEDERYDLNLTDIAEVWRRGSVISSWLLDLTADAFAKDEKLEGYSGHVADSGEGRWTIDAAMEEAVPVPALTAALFARFRSRTEHVFADQVLSAMRFGFGGHVEIPQ